MSTTSGFQSHHRATRRLLALLLLALTIVLSGCVEESDGSSNDSLIGDGGSGESPSESGASDSRDQGNDSGDSTSDGSNDEASNPSNEDGSDEGTSGEESSGGGSGSGSDDESDAARDDDDSNATDDTSGQVTLSWEPPATREDGKDFLPSEVDYYVVRYRHEDEDFQTLDSPAKITSTSVDINTLTPGERYHFKVQVIDQQGLASDFSEELATVVD